MRKTTMRSSRKAKPRKTTMTRRAKAWTATEVTKLKRSYRFKTTTEIARMLRRSLSSVKGKVRNLGLTKAAPMKKTTGKTTRTTTRKATTRRMTAKRTVKRRTTMKRKPARRRR